MVSLAPQSLDAFLNAHWRDPRPLRALDQPEAYPIGAFPPVVRDALLEAGRYTQAPDALVGGCALTAISAAVQTSYSVQRDAVLKGPASLYVLTIAESGERKSTVDNLFMSALRDWQRHQERAARVATAEYMNAVREWEQAEDRDEADRPKQPRTPRMLRGDDTSEALAKALAEYPVAAVVSAEAGVIFSGHSMNPDSVGRALAQANQMWDGGPIDQGRISRERVRIETLRVTMGLQVQPAMLDRFSEKTGGLGRGIGYFARFLMSQPPSTVGTRYYQEPGAGTPKLACFNARIAELLLAPAQFDDEDQMVTAFVPLDDHARQVWISFHDEVEEAMNPDHAYADIRDVASKAAENAARIACCFHIFEHGSQTPIGRDTMRKACVLTRWYLDEAIRFSRKHGATPELIDAEALETWLVVHHKKLGRTGASDTLAVNMARQLGPNRLRTSRARLDGALQLLQDYGRIRVQKGTGSKTEYIQIHPKVLAEWS